MRNKTFRSLLAAVAAIVGLSSFTVPEYDSIKVAAPFPMPAIAVYHFPARDFSIADFGAKKKGADTDKACIAANTAAFAKAMQACNAAGGGRVVVPDGEWPSGPIHFRSNCELHLSAGATVRFSPDPADFLPAVEVSWEGMECMNYSPMVYAYRCENIAITGQGRLTPTMDVWKVWFKRPKPHMDALARLYDWAYKGTPVAQRNMAEGQNHLRPHMIHFNQCRNVLLDGFKIRNSPFWTIHPVFSDGIIIRNVHIKNPYDAPNTDGIDIESTSNVEVLDSIVDVGDDGIALKSGSGIDGIRDNVPTKNVRISGCTVRAAHGGAVIGSETAAEISDLVVEDCVFDGTDRGIRIKSRRTRGGLIHDVVFRRITMKNNLCPFVINMYYRCGTTDQRLFSLDSLPVDEGTPVLYNVTVEDCHAEGSRASATFLNSLP